MWRAAATERGDGGPAMRTVDAGGAKGWRSEGRKWCWRPLFVLLFFNQRTLNWVRERMAKRLVLFWVLVLNLTFRKLRFTLLMRIPICFWIRHRLALWLQARIPARTSTTPMKAEVPKVLPASEQKRKHLPLPIRYPSSQAFLFLHPSSLWNPFFHSVQAIVPGIFTLFVDPRIRAQNKVCISKGRIHTGMFRGSRNAMEKMGGKKSPPSYTPIPVIIPTIC